MVLRAGIVWCETGIFAIGGTMYPVRLFRAKELPVLLPDQTYVVIKGLHVSGYLLVCFAKVGCAIQASLGG